MAGHGQLIIGQGLKGNTVRSDRAILLRHVVSVEAFLVDMIEAVLAGQCALQVHS